MLVSPRCQNARTMTARAVMTSLRAQGLEAHIHGSGVVTSQSPEAGASVAPGSAVDVTLGRLSLHLDDAPIEAESAGTEAARSR